MTISLGAATNDVRFMVLPLTDSNGDAVCCVVIFQLENKKETIPASWISGIDVMAPAPAIGLGMVVGKRQRSRSLVSRERFFTWYLLVIEMGGRPHPICGESHHSFHPCRHPKYRSRPSRQNNRNCGSIPVFPPFDQHSRAAQRSQEEIVSERESAVMLAQVPPNGQRGPGEPPARPPLLETAPGRYPIRPDARSEFSDLLRENVVDVVASPATKLPVIRMRLFLGGIIAHFS